LDAVTPILLEYQPKFLQSSKFIFKESKFYGRQYKIFEQIDPLTEKNIDFDKIIYLKNFITQNNINKNQLTKKLLENLLKAERLYKKFLISQKENSTTTMTLYFNILSMINLDDYKILNKHDEIDYLGNISDYSPSEEQKANLEKIRCIFKSFIGNSTLYKFKDIYIKFLNNYNELLKLDQIFNNHKENCELILHNLFNLSAVRVLSEKEQEYLLIFFCFFFFKIFNPN